MTISATYIGIDVAKTWIDIFDPETRRHSRCKNTPKSLKLWVTLLKDQHIIFEATSGCDGNLIDALVANGLRYARVNPLQARQFARAIDVLSKKRIKLTHACRKAVYLSMREVGKPAKVALIAVARRLLVRLNAIMKTQSDYAR